MVLSDRTIREEIAAGRIVVEPLGENAIQPASIDVHLDKTFLVFRNSRLPYIDVRQSAEALTEKLEKASGRPKFPFSQNVVLVHMADFLYQLHFRLTLYLFCTDRNFSPRGQDQTLKKGTQDSIL